MKTIALLTVMTLVTLFPARSAEANFGFGFFSSLGFSSAVRQNSFQRRNFRQNNRQDFRNNFNHNFRNNFFVPRHAALVNPFIPGYSQGFNQFPFNQGYSQQFNSVRRVSSQQFNFSPFVYGQQFSVGVSYRRSFNSAPLIVCH